MSAVNPFTATMSVIIPGAADTSFQQYPYQHLYILNGTAGQVYAVDPNINQAKWRITLPGTVNRCVCGGVRPAWIITSLLARAGREGSHDSSRPRWPGLDERGVMNS